MEKDISTVVNHLNAIGYHHRVRTGTNPISLMPRASLMIRGLRRAKGPAQRKLPISLEDLRTLNGMIGHKQIDRQIQGATVLLGWFCMLRMGELFPTSDPNRPPGRHPVLVSDIDPLCGGNITHWGPHVGEITLRISGPKTDWLMDV